jgi:hypothetical protein
MIRRVAIYSPIWVAITRPVSVFCKTRLMARGSGFSSFLRRSPSRCFKIFNEPRSEFSSGGRLVG